MANFVFGDLQEIKCVFQGKTHRFYPKANETFNVDQGGIRTNDDASQTTSKGDMMRQLNRVRWMVDGAIAVDTISNDELTILNKMSGSPESGIWQFYLVSGSVFKGVGSPVGDLQYDTNAGTINLKVSGNRELEKIL